MTFLERGACEVDRADKWTYSRLYIEVATLVAGLRPPSAFCSFARRTGIACYNSITLIPHLVSTGGLSHSNPSNYPACRRLRADWEAVTVASAARAHDALG